MKNRSGEFATVIAAFWSYSTTGTDTDLDSHVPKIVSVKSSSTSALNKKIESGPSAALALSVAMASHSILTYQVFIVQDFSQTCSINAKTLDLD